MSLEKEGDGYEVSQIQNLIDFNNSHNLSLKIKEINKRSNNLLKDLKI